MARKIKQLDKSGLQLQEIDALTKNQLLAFETDKHLMLHGMAGTGKTFISLYLGFDDIQKSLYDKVVIIRSAVPTRDIGFLPGGEKEKASVYEEPYSDICQRLFQRGDAYSILKAKKIVEFMTTSFIRGVTLRDAVIIVDECQNMSFHELDSIITRIGDNCRVMFCGDFRQSDFVRSHEKKGMVTFLNIIKSMDQFLFVDFQIEDIVRSDFVKQYLIQKENWTKDGAP